MGSEAERKYDEVYRKMNMLDIDLQKALDKVQYMYIERDLIIEKQFPIFTMIR